MREGGTSEASVPALVKADSEVRRSEVERFRREISGEISAHHVWEISRNQIFSQASQTCCSTTSQCRREPGQLRPDMI